MVEQAGLDKQGGISAVLNRPHMDCHCYVKAWLLALCWYWKCLESNLQSDPCQECP